MDPNEVEPVVSERFDINDIRQIRECNARRHLGMTAEEIVVEIRSHTDGVIEQMELRVAGGLLL